MDIANLDPERVYESIEKGVCTAICKCIKEQRSHEEIGERIIQAIQSGTYMALTQVIGAKVGVDGKSRAEVNGTVFR